MTSTRPEIDLLVKAAIAVVLIAVGLLSIVIVVGLLQEKLDPTAAALSLVGLITTIVSGAILRGKGGGGQQ